MPSAVNKKSSESLKSPKSPKLPTRSSKSSPKIASLMTSPPKEPKANPMSMSKVKLDNIPDDIFNIMFKNLNILQVITMYNINKSFSNKKNLLFDFETLDLSNVKINPYITKFIDDHIDKMKIKKIILDNISFASDEDFQAFILSIRLRKFINVEELVISNFDSIEGKYPDPYGETINYFNRLIESVGFFTNLKKLSITHINIITETNWDDNELFTETFVEMLGYLENLTHLIFDYNNIEEQDQRMITKGIRKINKNKRRINKIKPYERSHNIFGT